jgi:hypothetical protein
MSEPENKSANIEDLDKPVDAKKAEEIKGGASMTIGTTPILVKTLDPRLIVPCV